jgi:5-formyltetrahydrofolate cyclo-ligase
VPRLRSRHAEQHERRPRARLGGLGAVVIADAKAELRRGLRARRAERSAEERARLGNALAAHAGALGPGPVAAFVGIRGEPSTLPLLAALQARGVRVLLPLLLADLDLEWADYDGDSDALAEGARGILHPAGPSLGLGGIAAAKLVLAPALAVDAAGHRLGQGGGSYDRALARTEAPVLAVVFDDELITEVPTEPHDQPVSGVLTPVAGVRRF